MSRLARVPISLGNIQCKIDDAVVVLTKSGKNVEYSIPKGITVKLDDQGIHCSSADQHNKALLGTTFRNLSNCVIGLQTGFSKTLKLVGVGYKVAMQGRQLTLTLGKSHPDIFSIPEGIDIQCPDQTTIIVSGADKQQVGQVCANLIKLRVPDAYKGKGVRDTSRNYILKEVKK